MKTRPSYADIMAKIKHSGERAIDAYDQTEYAP